VPPLARTGTTSVGLLSGARGNRVPQPCNLLHDVSEHSKWQVAIQCESGLCHVLIMFIPNSWKTEVSKRKTYQACGIHTGEFQAIIFWIMTPYSPIFQYLLLWRYCVYLQSKITMLKMMKICPSETLVFNHQITLCHSLGDYTYELKFHKVKRKSMCLIKHHSMRMRVGVQIEQATRQWLNRPR
jgi:hypothetical protein